MCCLHSQHRRHRPTLPGGQESESCDEVSLLAFPLLRLDYDVQVHRSLCISTWLPAHSQCPWLKRQNMLGLSNQSDLVLVADSCTGAVALYYFFAHFDFILIRERPMGRRGRLRMYTYGTYLLFVVVINCTIGSIRYEGKAGGKSKCVKQIMGTLYMSWYGILVILLVEMVCLTANFWKVAYHDDRNKTGSQRSAKTHLKMTACVVTTASSPC